jgi:hypothetical protein
VEEGVTWKKAELNISLLLYMIQINSSYIFISTKYVILLHTNLFYIICLLIYTCVLYLICFLLYTCHIIVGGL